MKKMRLSLLFLVAKYIIRLRLLSDSLIQSDLLKCLEVSINKYILMFSRSVTKRTSNLKILLGRLVLYKSTHKAWTFFCYNKCKLPKEVL